MANKMISAHDLHDPFLSGLIRGQEPEKAPAGFTGSVMSKISTLPQSARLQPFSPPGWLKWGIPVVIGISLLTGLVWGFFKQPPPKGPGLALPEQSLHTASAWFSELKISFRLPDLGNPEIIIWIFAGGLFLGMSFWLVSQILERRTRA